MTTFEALQRLGPVVEIDTMLASKARELARAIEEVPQFETQLIEVRQQQDFSSLLLEISVSVGQAPLVDIQSKELLVISFDIHDNAWPTVLALRNSFPKNVPHLNIVRSGFPPSLCLSMQPYDEAKLSWSPGYYLCLVRNWLEQTALGTLHKPDQSLEPFLVQAVGTLLIPEFLSTTAETTVRDWTASLIGDRLYRIERGTESTLPRANLAIVVHTVPVRVHFVETLPHTVAELAPLVDSADFNLVATIKDDIRNWQTSVAVGHMQALLEKIPLLILRIPINRGIGGDVERHEIWAFKLAANVYELGVQLEIIDPTTPSGLLIGVVGNSGTTTSISAFSVQYLMSKELAALYNNQPAIASSIVVVGVGALGSQIVMNLVRGGIFPSTLIDKDQLMPHNIARHLLGNSELGAPKALAVAEVLNKTISHSPTVIGINQDVTTLVTSEILLDAAIILDISASVATARFLVLDVLGPGRRFSIFLNSTGKDLILFAEDALRQLRLDHIEMQYYWHVAKTIELKDHFASNKTVRYGGGCQEISGRIRQTTIATHAGNGAAAFCRSITDDVANASIWRLDESTGAIKYINLPLQKMREVLCGEWTVYISEELISELIAQRQVKLPNETGGVLIGTTDMQRQIVYLVGSIPSPQDSCELPVSYRRGAIGLNDALSALCTRAGNNLRYIGEWHSHPASASTEPSDNDKALYAWITDCMIVEGFPAIMLITSDLEIRCIIGSSADGVAFQIKK